MAAAAMRSISSELPCEVVHNNLGFAQSSSNFGLHFFHPISNVYFPIAIRTIEPICKKSPDILLVFVVDTSGVIGGNGVVESIILFGHL